MKFMEEAEQLILASNGSQFAFGESFLLAKGIQLTGRDLLRPAGPYGLEAEISQKLLSGTDSALQLAAWSGGSGRERRAEMKESCPESVQEHLMSNASLLKSRCSQQV